MSAHPSLSSTAVVLSRTSHPGNIGAAARAMKTMGLADLVLVAPRHFPDAEATARAAGAADVLDRARVVPTLPEALGDRVLAVGFSARGRDLAHAVRDWRELAPEVLASAGGGPVALVFGNETSGLDNDEMLACQCHAWIPANPAYSSLNLAAAVQVACYELAQAAGGFASPPMATREPASLAQVAVLQARVGELLRATGFLDPRQPGRAEERLRRLASRARLEREEVALLHGILDALERRR